ncbi:DUF5677 domain-containing protein [Candidatus Palauibacter irciniicola]|uniref:DUF5677 domain-containing protein n=1 Tax=Candidatus Palauibacter irciniicola TaxID=3056733 RepID=UPI003B010449
MPTEPVRYVLDRPRALENVQQFNEHVQPVLQEVVNYSARALLRCMRSTPPNSTPDVHVVHFALFRQIIELADAVEILLSHACVAPSKPLLRSMFEAMLSLQYQLEDEASETRRTLSWVHADVYQRRRSSERIRDRELTDRILEGMPDDALKDTERHIQAMTAFLNKPHMKEVVDAYAAHSHRRPRWYSLFGGPQTLRDLAKHLGWLDFYDIKYREWSTMLHAQGPLQEVMRPAGKKQVSMRGLRHPDDLYGVALFTLTFLLSAMATLTDRFRAGEAREREEWYKAEVRPAIDRLVHTRVTVEEETVGRW